MFLGCIEVLGDPYLWYCSFSSLYTRRLSFIFSSWNYAKQRLQTSSIIKLNMLFAFRSDCKSNSHVSYINLVSCIDIFCSNRYQTWSVTKACVSLCVYMICFWKICLYTYLSKMIHFSEPDPLPRSHLLLRYSWFLNFIATFCFQNTGKPFYFPVLKTISRVLSRSEWQQV